MNPHLPNDVNPDLIAKVKGSLLINMIKGILHNRWDTGPGLISEKGANGGIIRLDPNVIPSFTFTPKQYMVKEVFGDYLKCLAYTPETFFSDPNTVNIAKPPELRSGSQTWTTEPAYRAASDGNLGSIITALSVPFVGVIDDQDQDITIVDLNVDGRRSDSFWARIDSAAGGTDNQWQYDWTEMERTLSGWSVLSGGRTGSSSMITMPRAINSVEANNDDSGVEGNSINLAGPIFTDNTGLTVQSIRGLPIVRMYETNLGDNVKVYTVQYVNAIDGECA